MRPTRAFALLGAFGIALGACSKPCEKLAETICRTREGPACTRAQERAKSSTDAQQEECKRLLASMEKVEPDAFKDYIRRSKASEARESLHKIFMGAKAYYEEDRVNAMGAVLPPQIPASAGSFPAGSACDHPNKKYPAQAWTHPSWKALLFSLDDPHYFRYTFLSEGSGEKSSFTARAEADLDCNGKWTTFEIQGRAAPNRQLTRLGTVRQIQPTP